MVGPISQSVAAGGGKMNEMGLKSTRMLQAVRECIEILKQTSPDSRLNYEGKIYKLYGYQPTDVVDQPGTFACPDRATGYRQAERAYFKDSWNVSGTAFSSILRTMVSGDIGASA